MVVAMTWKEIAAMVVDVAIVYYVIYRVLLLMKGTRAAQILVGLALVGGGFFLAKQLHLATVSWLLDNLVSYGILLVIIVFQQDIRRGLLQLGRNLFDPTRTAEHLAMCEQVVAAAVESPRATFVLERETPVDDLLAGGWNVDGAVTRESLAALAPGGAILIHDLRIARAGCSVDLDRLAIRSDAVAVVVEAGAIALHEGGRILASLDEASLRKALLGLFQKARKRKGGSGVQVVDAGAKSG
jgi:diadenylate cyclase